MSTRLTPFIPVLLTPEEMADPTMVLFGFLDSFTLNDIRKYLREVNYAALARNDADLGPMSRPEIIYHFQEMERVWEAIYVVTHSDES